MPGLVASCNPHRCADRRLDNLRPRRRPARTLDLVYVVENVILTGLYWAALALHILAFVDATIRPNAGYVATERLTKPAWMGITALAAVVTWLSGPISFLGIPALVASILYFVDVRPALRGTSPGNAW